MNKVKEAIDFAVEKHVGQFDKAGKPYIGHPLRVAFSVISFGEKYFITALLHDVVEDCGVLISEIEDRWGKEIAEAVLALSRINEPVKETYKTFIERISINEIARIVKLADIEDNTRPERIACLPIDQQGIVERYRKAKEYLESHGTWRYDATGYSI